MRKRDGDPARAGLVRARTSLINTVRGLTKSYGERLRGCNPWNMNPEKAQGLSPELQAALEPLLGEIESRSERIGEYNEQIEQISKASYPEAARLKRVKGVGTLIALTYVLTLEDAHRFGKSRDVGCYVGLQPGRRNSGQSEPQLHISKEGDPYLRTLLVQGAHHILGPFGADSDLRRWGLKLAERGGKNGKKRAVIAVARKLAVLLRTSVVSYPRVIPIRTWPAVPETLAGTRKWRQCWGYKPRSRKRTKVETRIEARVMQVYVGEQRRNDCSLRIFQSGFILLPRHAIDSGGSLTLECVKAIAEQSDAQMVKQSGEPFLLPRSCCLPHTVPSLGHAFPALCRAHV